MREIVIRLTVPDGVGVHIEEVSEMPPPLETPAPVVRTIAAAPAGPMWQVGAVHAQGHNPLRSNARGLFCPTKIDGNWCAWRP